MRGNRVKQIEDILVLGFGVQILLHLYLSFLNLANGIDKGYGHSFPVHSYVLIGVYLLIVLATDAFMLCQRRFEPAKALCRYWGSAFIAVALVLFLYFVMSGAADMIKALSLLYAPCVVLRPLLEFLGITANESFDYVSVTAVGCFCLFNWAVCKFAVRAQ